MTSAADPDQVAIYHRAQQLGHQLAHNLVDFQSAGRTAFYLSHVLAHRLPHQSQERHLDFLEYLVDQAAQAEHHRIVMAEARVRGAVRPLLELDRPSTLIERAAAAAAVGPGQLTSDEIELILLEEVAWLNRRRRQHHRHAS